MRALGYTWQQSTIAKIEMAQRPLRLNELADIASIFGAPATHFLRPDPDDGADLDAVEHEVRGLLKNRLDAAKVAGQLEMEYIFARNRFDEATDDVHQIDSRLETLKLWHPRYDEIAKAVLEEIAAATATQQAFAYAVASNPESAAAMGWTPEHERRMQLEELLRPYTELLREDQLDRITEFFKRAVDTCMDKVRGAPVRELEK